MSFEENEFSEDALLLAADLKLASASALRVLKLCGPAADVARRASAKAEGWHEMLAQEVLALEHIDEFCSIPVGALRRGEVSELDVSRKNLIPAEVYCIIDNLKSSRSVTSLNVSHNALKVDSAQALAITIWGHNYMGP